MREGERGVKEKPQWLRWQAAGGVVNSSTYFWLDTWLEGILFDPSFPRGSSFSSRSLVLPSPFVKVGYPTPVTPDVIVAKSYSAKSNRY